MTCVHGMESYPRNEHNQHRLRIILDATNHRGSVGPMEGEDSNKTDVFFVFFGFFFGFLVRGGGNFFWGWVWYCSVIKKDDELYRSISK